MQLPKLHIWTCTAAQWSWYIWIFFVFWNCNYIFTQNCNVHPKATGKSQRDTFYNQARHFKSMYKIVINIQHFSLLVCNIHILGKNYKMVVEPWSQPATHIKGAVAIRCITPSATGRSALSGDSPIDNLQTRELRLQENGESIDQSGGVCSKRHPLR